MATTGRYHCVCVCVCVCVRVTMAAVAAERGGSGLKLTEPWTAGLTLALQCIQLKMRHLSFFFFFFLRCVCLVCLHECVKDDGLGYPVLMLISAIQIVCALRRCVCVCVCVWSKAGFFTSCWALDPLTSSFKVGLAFTHSFQSLLTLSLLSEHHSLTLSLSLSLSLFLSLSRSLLYSDFPGKEGLNYHSSEAWGLAEEA